MHIGNYLVGVCLAGVGGGVGTMCMQAISYEDKETNSYQARYMHSYNY